MVTSEDGRHTGILGVIDYSGHSSVDGGFTHTFPVRCIRPFHQAPELQVAEGQGTTAASDVFAFGMTMLELFTGAPPFSEIKNDIAVLLKYQQGIRPSRPTDPGKNRENNNRLDERKNASICVAMDDNTWDLVQRCWNQDLRRRPTTRQVLKWFQPQRKQAR
ncbi:hypothetical protein FRC12_010158 [Ceratobasidium sp. 428]|nr:hypothetical protein FRC12_010158 [Ceratobasidium sp. 428]